MPSTPLRAKIRAPFGVQKYASTVHDQSQRFQIDLRLQKLTIGQSCHNARPPSALVCVCYLHYFCFSKFNRLRQRAVTVDKQMESYNLSG